MKRRWSSAVTSTRISSNLLRLMLICWIVSVCARIRSLFWQPMQCYKLRAWVCARKSHKHRHCSRLLRDLSFERKLSCEMNEWQRMAIETGNSSLWGRHFRCRDSSVSQTKSWQKTIFRRSVFDYILLFSCRAMNRLQRQTNEEKCEIWKASFGSIVYVLAYRPFANQTVSSVFGWIDSIRYRNAFFLHTRRRGRSEKKQEMKRNDVDASVIYFHFMFMCAGERMVFVCVQYRITTEEKILVNFFPLRWTNENSSRNSFRWIKAESCTSFSVRTQNKQ